MPYYCTVPQCTSMAGKAKDVSFHQFPRDELLAQKWNIILKRGKPYTKYSKVCSRHFTSSDYTITSMGKHKGQWRSLRKDAIPSQNIPHEIPYVRNAGTVDFDPLFSNQQLASLLYLQAISNSVTFNLSALAKVDQGTVDSGAESADDDEQGAYYDMSDCAASDSNLSDSDVANRTGTTFPTPSLVHSRQTHVCSVCLRCFKDPSVFEIHTRTHLKKHDG